jgi:hypothetical protein
MAKVTFGRIRRELKRIDPGLTEGTDDWTVAALLLSSASVGPNLRRLAKFAGMPRRVVRPWAQKFRQKGLWHGARVADSGWFEKDGGIAFALDCCVARGLVERTAA